MRLIKKGLFGFLIFAQVITILGCSDPLKQETLLKDKVLPKTLINEKADYIYVPSVVQSPRSVGASRPFWQGAEKRVRIKFNENALVVYELEGDDRFSQNPTNQKPVFEIPISHKAYKCAEDSYGDCTSREQEDLSITWVHKPYFRPEFENIDLSETNTLPIQISNLFENCYTEIGSEFINYQIDQESINFQVEKTFKVQNLSCLRDFQSLSDLAFKVRYHYSLMKLSALATPNYKPLEYPHSEENLFGYFNTEKTHLDPDNNLREDGKVVYVNRWAPNTTADYYLNAAFSRPKYAKLRQATEVAFATINNSLAQAGAQFRLNLKGVDESLEVGDVRNSMIILVEDPQASGVIGYGPSVTNPLTGEILQARTVMYLGTIKKFVQYTYDDILKDLARPITPMSSVTEQSIPVVDLRRSISVESSTSRNSKVRSLALPSHSDKFIRPVDPILADPDWTKEEASPLLVGQGLEGLTSDLKSRLETLSRHNAYSAEVFNFNATLEKAVKQVVQDVGYKPWVDLSKDEQERVLEVLVPYVWLPTLVHELGHNLGLRHNFSGSNDMENFYSEEEARQFGSSQQFKYSSVMDYAYRSTNELRVMGKYDIAALKYAYSEKIQLADQTEVSLQEFRKNSELEIKTYHFCTDEHVSVNPDCNRFDEGTNLTEIVAHLRNAYESRYKRSNFRNSRANFSLLGDVSQALYMQRLIGTLRLTFERYETIKNNFNLPDESELWETNAFLKDIKMATIAGSNFMMDILKTPDLHCVIARTSDNEVVAAIPIVELSTRAVDCFDQNNVRLNTSFKVVGQFGKPFQSKKSTTNSNPYADQIDVRGIWIDKLIAAKFLMQRKLGSRLFDRYTENYLHLPATRNAVLKVFADIVTDTHQGVFKYVDLDGNPAAVNIEYSLNYGHKILTPMSRSLARYMGLPDTNISFQKQIISDFVSYNSTEEDEHKALSLFAEEMFKVYPVIPRGREQEANLMIKIGVESFYAFDENLIASQLIDEALTVKKLSVFSDQALEKAISELKDPNKVQVSSQSSDEEIERAKKLIDEIGIEKASHYLQGSYKDMPTYANQLRYLLN